MQDANNLTEAQSVHNSQYGMHTSGHSSPSNTQSPYAPAGKYAAFQYAAYTVLLGSPHEMASIDKYFRDQFEAWQKEEPWNIDRLVIAHHCTMNTCKS